MTLKNFLKANFSLIIGLSLPVILVLGFLLASHIPQKLDTPPRYELVFSALHYDNHSPFHVDFAIRNQKLYMKLTPRKEQAGIYVKELFIYNGQKGSVRKIDYLLPQHLQNQQNDEMPVAEFNDFIIDNNSRSPDGFEFVSGSYRSRGILSEIFSSHSGRYVHRVKKTGGGNFIIPDYGNESSYGNFNFIGWIINSEKSGDSGHAQ